MLLTKTEATVGHWQHHITNFAYKKQRQQWGTGSTISPILRTKHRGNSGALAAPYHQFCIQKTEATVGHWQHHITNFAYKKQRQQWGTGSTISPMLPTKNRGNSGALAGPYNQFCLQKTEATVGHWQHHITNFAFKKQRQQWGTGSTISPILPTKNRGNSGALAATAHKYCTHMRIAT